MGKRKVFLLFLSAMSVSIIIMVIIYGIFIKDINFNLNVKNPDSAPSPLDNREEDDNSADAEMEEGSKNPANVQTPDNLASQEAANNMEAAGNEEGADEPITEVVPLEPQMDQIDKEDNPVPGGQDAVNATPEVEKTNMADSAGFSPTLHFVFLDGFSSRQSAEDAMRQFQERSLVAQPYIRQHRGQIILQFGVFSDKDNAEVMAQQLRSQNVFVKVD
jgi:hypothetical protein